MMRSFQAFALVAAFALLASCAPIAPEYSVEAYTQATRLKAESLDVMARATQPFAAHRERVEAVRLDVDAAYEFARALPRNEITARQWELMREPDGNLLFGFFELWEARPAGLSRAFVGEARAEIAAAFDVIICTEINKRTAEDC